jgi:N-acetylglucosamine-6-phosphate deacetylase
MSTNNGTLILDAERVVLPGEVREGISVVVENGRIAGLVERSQGTLPGATRVDLSGLTLLPGFIDVHIHGAVGVDTMEADVDGLERVARFLSTVGVTGWLPTLVPGPDDDYQRVAGEVGKLISRQEERQPAARALGVHYEGPFINQAQCGALRTPFFRTFTQPSDLAALARVSYPGAVHMITLAPEIDGGVELVRELIRDKWVVSIGHTRAPLDVLNSAGEAGARHMTHFMNAMAPLHHRSPGPIGWGLVRDDVTCDIIADGVHTDPLILKLALRCKTAERLTLISDAVAPTGLGDGEYQIWGEKIEVVERRTRNERGSIAGSVMTILDGLKMMSSLGVPLHAASRMASLNPATLLGVADEMGSIEAGKRADLIAVDKNLDVVQTFVGGLNLGVLGE